VRAGPGTPSRFSSTPSRFSFEVAVFSVIPADACYAVMVGVAIGMAHSAVWSRFLSLHHTKLTLTNNEHLGVATV